MKPVRIQRKRTKGWVMPPNTIYVGRTSGEFASARPYANPFRVGGYFKVGNGGAGFMWLEAHPEYADASFTKIESAAQAIAMFREFRKRYPYTEAELAELRRYDHVACWCPLDQPCHADVLLELANAEAPAEAARA